MRSTPTVDTWEFDGPQWRQAATDGPPGARQLPILTYDPLRQAILLFGGGEYPPYGGPDYKFRNDVWEWNGSAWSEISVEGTLPTPVIAAAGAYDPRRGRLVQFGGATVLPNFCRLLTARNVSRHSARCGPLLDTGRE